MDKLVTRSVRHGSLLDQGERREVLLLAVREDAQIGQGSQFLTPVSLLSGLDQPSLSCRYCIAVHWFW